MPHRSIRLSALFRKKNRDAEDTRRMVADCRISSTSPPLPKTTGTPPTFTARPCRSITGAVPIGSEQAAVGSLANEDVPEFSVNHHTSSSEFPRRSKNVVSTSGRPIVAVVFFIPVSYALIVWRVRLLRRNSIVRHIINIRISKIVKKCARIAGLHSTFLWHSWDSCCIFFAFVVIM